MDILHIIPYNEFFPAKNGGALRCAHLCIELSKYHNLTLVTLQTEKSLRANGFPSHIKVINPEKEIPISGLRNKFINAIKYRFYRRSIKGSADITFLVFFPVIKRLLAVNNYDIVIYEHLHSMLLSPLVRRTSPKTVQILDQHNVDHLLFAQEIGNVRNRQHAKRYKSFLKIESNLHKKVDKVLACSERDKNIFHRLNKGKVNIQNVPNGVDVISKPFHHDKDFNSSELIFCGDLSTPANKDALMWFYSEIWPQLLKIKKDITLSIVGRNGDNKFYKELKESNNINFIGEVPDLTPYYHKSNVSIVPLRIGSGTRLKILEAMCYGNPVVSSSKGAEGIDYTNNKDILIADKVEDFINQILFLINNPDKAKEISREAHHLVHTKYSWGIIGYNLSRSL